MAGPHQLWPNVARMSQALTQCRENIVCFGLMLRNVARFDPMSRESRRECRELWPNVARMSQALTQCRENVASFDPMSRECRELWPNVARMLRECRKLWPNVARMSWALTQCRKNDDPAGARGLCYRRGDRWREKAQNALTKKMRKPKML